MQQPGLIDRREDEGDPPAQTIAATEQFAQPLASRFDAFAQGCKKHRLGHGKGQAGCCHREQGGLRQRITGCYSIHYYNALQAGA